MTTTDNLLDDDGADELSALRDRITEALTAEHYRRAHEQIVASPEEHQAACADVVMDVLGPELERQRGHKAERAEELKRLRTAVLLYVAGLKKDSQLVLERDPGNVRATARSQVAEDLARILDQTAPRGEG